MICGLKSFSFAKRSNLPPTGRRHHYNQWYLNDSGGYFTQNVSFLPKSAFGLKKLYFEKKWILDPKSARKAKMSRFSLFRPPPAWTDRQTDRHTDTQRTGSSNGPRLPRRKFSSRGRAAPPHSNKTDVQTLLGNNVKGWEDYVMILGPESEIACNI